MHSSLILKRLKMKEVSLPEHGVRRSWRHKDLLHEQFNVIFLLIKHEVLHVVCIIKLRLTKRPSWSDAWLDQSMM